MAQRFPTMQVLLCGEFSNPESRVNPGDLGSIQLDERGNLMVKLSASGTTISVIEPKDVSRNPVTLYLDRIAGVTAEALATLNITSGLAAQTPATSYTVPAGKAFRLQSITITLENTSSTAVNGRVRIRAAASGLSVSSPVAFHSDLPELAGTQSAGAGQSIYVAIPSGTQIGISHIESSVSSTVSVCVMGYEY